MSISNTLLTLLKIILAMNTPLIDGIIALSCIISFAVLFILLISFMTANTKTFRKTLKKLKF